jgi:phosphate transport system substrate-binding protein
MRNLNLAAWLVAAACMMFGGAVLAAEGGDQAEKKDSLTIEGSTTVGPIADAYAEYFQKLYPKLKVTVKNTGSGNGITALIEGRCDIATSSRFMKPDEFKKAVEKGVMPVAHVLSMDGICMAVNPANSILGLSSAQIKDLYTGKVKNWKDVGGPDMEVVVISRDTASGTFEAFNEMVMKKEKMAEGVQFVSSSKEVHARVSTTKGAIGYVGLGFLDEAVKAVNVDGVTPTKKTITSGKYPLSRPLFMITNGYPDLGGLIHEVVTFHLGEKGQKMVEAKGYIPVTDY